MRKKFENILPGSLFCNIVGAIYIRVDHPKWNALQFDPHSLETHPVNMRENEWYNVISEPQENNIPRIIRYFTYDT